MIPSVARSLWNWQMLLIANEQKLLAAVSGNQEISDRFNEFLKAAIAAQYFSCCRRLELMLHF